MPSMWKVKKLGALFIQGFLPAFMLFFFLMFGYNIVYGLVAMMVSILLGIFIFTLLTKHPLMQLMEGQGLLALTFDSTGVIEPFIVKVNPPFVEGKMAGGRKATTLFDRQTIFYTKAPQPGTLDYKGEATEKDENNADQDYNIYRLRVPKGKEGQITFAFQQWPTLIYNKNLGAFLTKDSLAKIETEGIIKHLVLYLKVKTEELTSIMRDFARYVIEMTKPKTSWLAGKGGLIMWLIFGAAIVIMIILFAPQIMNVLAPALTGAKSAIGGAVQNIPGTIKTVT